MDKFTHAQLVDIAARWLQARKNVVVITELVSAARETPDALGFAGDVSTVVECKTSRSDFLADAKKFFRRDAWKGMGQKRYYLAPKGLLKVEELPQGWGLVEVLDSGRTMCMHDAGAYFEKDASAEITLLISALRRIGQTTPSGISIRCYTMQTQCKATLGVAVEDENKEDEHADVKTDTGEVRE